MSDTMQARPVEEAKPYLLFGVLSCLVGGALLLFTDFGGWTDYYDYYVAIGAEETPGYATPLLLATGLGLLFAGFCAATALGASVATAAARVRAAVIAASAVVGVILGGTLVFMQEVSDTDGWWLDTGFYGGLIGAGLAAFLFQRALRAQAIVPEAPMSGPRFEKETEVEDITPPPSAAGSPASWQPDPWARHELRYWSGTGWTAHVSDGGVQDADPVT